MKTTDEFKKVVEAHLRFRAFRDPLFAKTLQKPNKNMDDCVAYILNQVKKSGSSGFTDDEIFGMAVHYYDEDDIVPGDSQKCDIIINKQVKLTDEEIAEAKKKALDEIVEKEKERLMKKPEKKTSKKSSDSSTLFKT